MGKIVLILALIIFTPQAMSLGQNGHRIVAQIAEDNLTPTAKKNISQLIKGVPLAKLSTWPDEIRSDKKWKHTAPWHYISVADDEKVSDVKAGREGNILVAMGNMEKTLSDPKASNQNKWQALAFYVHFVADLHQPFHVGRKEDRGGNDIKLSWFGEYSNIHRVWDTDLIEHQRMSYTEYADFINDIEPKTIAKWQSSDKLDWAQESKDLREHVYNLPENGRLHYEFAYKNTPIINKRMAQAGFRLAAKLNQWFGKK